MSDHLSFKPPTSIEELNAIQGSDVVFETPSSGRVVRLSEGVVAKYRRWPQNLAEEVMCLRVAADLGISVPKVLYVPIPPEEQESWSIPTPPLEGTPRSSSLWCICMEEIAGVPLKDVVDDMSDADLNSIGLQLKDILSDMQRKTSTYIGSVSGGPLRSLMSAPWSQPSCTFATVQDFMHCLHGLLVECPGGEARAAEILGSFPTNDAICFTHGDLVPKNIMVDPICCKITAIIDWEYGGFYPAFWEYCAMHDPMFLTPGWSKVLNVIFPEPRKQDQINAMRKMILSFPEFL